MQHQEIHSEKYAAPDQFTFAFRGFFLVISLHPTVKKEQSKDQAHGPEHVLVQSDARQLGFAAPRRPAASPIRVVFDEKDRNRDDDIGATFYHPADGLFRVGFSKQNQ